MLDVLQHAETIEFVSAKKFAVLSVQNRRRFHAEVLAVWLRRALSADSIARPADAETMRTEWRAVSRAGLREEKRATSSWWRFVSGLAGSAKRPRDRSR